MLLVWTTNWNCWTIAAIPSKLLGSHVVYRVNVQCQNLPNYLNIPTYYMGNSLSLYCDQTFALLTCIAINCNLLNYCNKLQYFNRILAYRNIAIEFWKKCNKGSAIRFFVVNIIILNIIKYLFRYWIYF